MFDDIKCNQWLQELGTFSEKCSIIPGGGNHFDLNYILYTINMQNTIEGITTGSVRILFRNHKRMGSNQISLFFILNPAGRGEVQNRRGSDTGRQAA